jgi:hypothetical protein
MNPLLSRKTTVLLGVTQLALAGCNRFVWHEDPFTPDQAPTSETLVAGSDTTYVLKRASYYLLSSQRSALWNRDVLDDVAWRYHALFGEYPSVIAVRIDSVPVGTDTTTTWRGVPFARVAVSRRTQVTPNKRNSDRVRDYPVNDSARVRALTGPMLAATAAGTWLKARALDARVSDSQPGGPMHVSSSVTSMPAWIEAGAVRMLGTAGAADRAADELRLDPKHIVSLATLFTYAWPVRPDAATIVRIEDSRFDLDTDGRQNAGRTRGQRESEPGGASPLFISQSVSVLAFIHERDPRLVARLADELSRGASIPDVLASSRTLPHDVAGLDAAWREWLKRTQRNRR